VLTADSVIIQALSTPSAILDVHFGPLYISPHFFGVATSTGSFSIYQLREHRGANSLDSSLQHPEIVPFRTFQYFPEDVLITAFSWKPLAESVGMTLSDGQVCLGKVNLSHSNDDVSAIAMGQHELEAWTLAFALDGSSIYSGGDDSALKFFGGAATQGHTLSDTEDELPISWTDKKIHGAGVTAILPFFADVYSAFVLTGSYDDHIRLIQIPAVGRRTVLTELNLGGGVWRLKRLGPSSSGPTLPEEVLLLASCMHAGARILKLAKDEESNWQFEVLAKFEEHKSMNYGSDCQSSLNAKSQRTFITTSFYDRLLCLWRYSSTNDHHILEFFRHLADSTRLNSYQTLW
jgi:diphthamide biosynthesis protein 7